MPNPTYDPATGTPVTITNVNANGRALAQNSAPVVLASDQWTPGTPDITESNIQNWIRNGQGFLYSSGILVTATNPNLTVGGISIFNPLASGKSILLYSLQAHATQGSFAVVNATLADAALGAAITPQNANLGSANASVVTANSSATGIAASVTKIGTTILVIPQVNSSQEYELLPSPILLPAGSAHGLAVYLFIATAGNSFAVNVRGIEF